MSVWISDFGSTGSPALQRDRVDESFWEFERTLFVDLELQRRNLVDILSHHNHRKPPIEDSYRQRSVDHYVRFRDFLNACQTDGLDEDFLYHVLLRLSDLGDDQENSCLYASHGYQSSDLWHTHGHAQYKSHNQWRSRSDFRSLKVLAPQHDAQPILACIGRVPVR